MLVPYTHWSVICGTDLKLYCSLAVRSHRVANESLLIQLILSLRFPSLRCLSIFLNICLITRYYEIYLIHHIKLICSIDIKLMASWYHLIDWICAVLSTGSGKGWLRLTPSSSVSWTAGFCPVCNRLTALLLKVSVKSGLAQSFPYYSFNRLQRWRPAIPFYKFVKTYRASTNWKNVPARQHP